MDMYQDNLCFIDFETTGINVFIDEPIQIGAILTNKNLEVEKTFGRYIRLPSNQNYDLLLKRFEKSSKIHGITLETLEHVPSQSVITEDFFDILGTDYKFINWNIGFDNHFFKKMCYYTGRIESYNKINYRSVDLQTMCYTLKLQNRLPNNVNSLQDVADHFFIPREKSHNALDCAEVALKVYKEFLTLIKRK